MNKIKVEAKPDNLHHVFDFLVSHLEENGCEKKLIRKCKLCVEEIFLNIANYAYNPEVGTVTMHLEINDEPSPGKMVFLFEDYGKPFNPLLNETPDLDATLEERDIGGLGIFLVRENMDDISYENKDGKNILKLVKYLK